MEQGFYQLPARGKARKSLFLPVPSGHRRFFEVVHKLFTRLVVPRAQRGENNERVFFLKKKLRVTPTLFSKKLDFFLTDSKP